MLEMQITNGPKVVSLFEFDGLEVSGLDSNEVRVTATIGGEVIGAVRLSREDYEKADELPLIHRYA
jgi:hypothetical protein